MRNLTNEMERHLGRSPGAAGSGVESGAGSGSRGLSGLLPSSSGEKKKADVEANLSPSSSARSSGAETLAADPVQLYLAAFPGHHHNGGGGR